MGFQFSLLSNHSHWTITVFSKNNLVGKDRINLNLIRNRTLIKLHFKHFFSKCKYSQCNKGMWYHILRTIDKCVLMSKSNKKSLSRSDTYVCIYISIQIIGFRHDKEVLYTLLNFTGHILLHLVCSTLTIQKNLSYVTMSRKVLTWIVKQLSRVLSKKHVAFHRFHLLTEIFTSNLATNYKNRG